MTTFDWVMTTFDWVMTTFDSQLAAAQDIGIGVLTLSRRRVALPSLNFGDF